MTEKHCHFCRDTDVAEITCNDVSLFLCDEHGSALERILEFSRRTGTFMTGKIKLTGDSRLD